MNRCLNKRCTLIALTTVRAIRVQASLSANVQPLRWGSVGLHSLGWNQALKPDALMPPYLSSGEKEVG